MIGALSHVSVVVPDLVAACKRLQDTFGMDIGPIHVNERQGVRLAMVQLTNAKIELTEPLSRHGALWRFLERNPNGGLHHIALEVQSIEGTVSTLRAAGIGLAGELGFNVHGRPIAFVHPRDFLGVLLELEEEMHD